MRGGVGRSTPVVVLMVAAAAVIAGLALLTLQPRPTPLIVVGGGPTAKDAGVFVAARAGQPLQRVTGSLATDAQPGLSPDHQSLVFVRDSRIYVMGVDGRGLRALTRGTPGHPDAAPAWSPDGGRVAFLRRTTGGGIHDLYVVPVGGGGETRLAADVGGDAADIHPSWGPDGRHLVYADGGLLTVASLDSTCTAILARPPRGGDAQPAWSGDGSSIAFVSHADGDSAIAVIGADGAGRRRLSPKQALDSHPNWSTDNHSVIFERDAATPRGDIQIVEAEVDGGSETMLGKGPLLGSPSVPPAPAEAPAAYFGLTPAPPGPGQVLFAPAINCAAPTDRGALAVGDFNGDGHPDVVLLNRSTKSLYVLMGKGDGTFEPPLAFPLGDIPVAVSAGDFNGDGKLDVAVTTSSAVIIGLGDGHGSFNQVGSYPVAGGSAYGIESGRLRVNGPVDLVVTEGNPPGNSPALMSVFLGRGDGSFGPAATYPVASTYGSANHVDIVDFTGDGKPDVVVSASGCGYSSGGVDLFVGDGKGGLKPVSMSANGSAFGAICNGWSAVADFNHDGRPDLATLSGCFPLDGGCKSPSVKVWYGRGGGIVAPSPVIFNQADAGGWVIATDLNRDGFPEAVTGGAGGVWVQLGQSTGLHQPALFPVRGGASAIAVADFNGDGWPDVVAENGNGTVAVLLGAGGVPSTARSAFSRGLLDPRDISTDPRLLFTNALATLLVALLIVFPSNLFNSTLAANYDEIRGWVRPLARPLRGLRSSVTKIPVRYEIGLFLLAATIVIGLVDPGFGFNLHSVPIFVGMLGALAFGALVTGRLGAYYARWRLQLKHRFRVYPGALVVAVACVAISRVVHFLPGYVYGVVMGAELERDLDEKEQGPSIAFAFAATFLISIAAWVAWIPVKGLADRTSAVPFMVLDVLLAAIFVGGIEGILFGLIPVRFQPGAVLRRWSWQLWLFYFAIAGFALFHILLRPRPNSNLTPFAVVLGLFLLFGGVSVGFWAFFNFRAKDAQPPGSGIIPAAAILEPAAGDPSGTRPRQPRKKPARRGKTRLDHKTETDDHGSPGR